MTGKEYSSVSDIVSDHRRSVLTELRKEALLFATKGKGNALRVYLRSKSDPMQGIYDIEGSSGPVMRLIVEDVMNNRGNEVVINERRIIIDWEEVVAISGSRNP